MAIAFVAAGTSVAGTTSVAPTTPAAVDAGQLILLLVASKYPAAPPTTPTGFTLIGSASGGQGVAGIDSGDALVTAYYKVADGTEDSLVVTVTITGGNTARGHIFTYSKSSTKDWAIASTGGPMSVAGVAWAVTGAANPGISGGDVVFVSSAVNGNLATFTTEALLATGIVVGAETERGDLSTANGDDCAQFGSDHFITSGTSSAAPTYTAVGSATLADTPAGASLFIRMREVEIPQVGSADGTSTAAAVGSSIVAASGSGLPVNGLMERDGLRKSLVTRGLLR